MLAALRNTVGKSFRVVRAIMSDGVAYTACAHVFQNTNTLKLRAVIKGAANIVTSDIRGKNCFGGSSNDTNWILNNYNSLGGSFANIEFQVYSGSAMIGSKIWPTLINGEFHEVIIEKTGSSGRLLLDGDQIATGTATGTPANGRVCVFTQNNVGGSAVAPIPNRVPRKVLFAAFQLWEGSDIVADLIPVIANDGEPCFFDRVANDFARNLAGSGSFIAGE